jgi:trigger factor
MKKQSVSAVILAGVMVLGLTGCGSSSSKAKAYSKYVTLGDYKNVEYTMTVEEVTDDEVQSQVDSFVSGLAETTDVTDRAVEEGDTVNIDYVGTKDGEEFDGGSAEGYDLEIGSGTFIDGFEDGLIGHEIGEEVSLDLTFPEDYSSEDLAGADVNFAVTINSISVTTTPELTDDLVKENTDYDTIEDYEASIRENLEESNQESAESQAKSDLITKVVENATISGYDEDEVKELVDQEFDSFKQTAESYSSYGYEYEDVLSLYGYSTEDELKEGITEYVKEYLDQKMVVYCIAAEEKITVSGDETDALVQEYMETYSIDSEDEVYDYFGDDFFEYRVMYDKVMDVIMESAVLVDSTEEDTEETSDDETDADDETTEEEADSEEEADTEEETTEEETTEEETSEAESTTEEAETSEEAE